MIWDNDSYAFLDAECPDTDGAENGPWRNFYLMGAKELEEGAATTDLDTTNPEMAMALTVEQLVDSLAVRVDGPRAWDTELVIDLVVTDGPDSPDSPGTPVAPSTPARHRLTLHDGALTHRTAGPGAASWAPAGLTLTLSKPQLLSVLAGGGLDGIEQSGDASLFGDLFALLVEPDTSFPIVTP